MTTCVLSREGETVEVGGVVIYVVEVYSISELDQSAAELSDLEILAQARGATGTPVPDSSDTREGLTRPTFRVFRSMTARHKAKVRVTWGARYIPGGGFTSVQTQRTVSRDEVVLQPFLRRDIVQDASGNPVSVTVLDHRRIDRLIIETMYRRLLTTQISIETIDQTVRDNRRKYYTINGATKILSRHDIVPVNQTQFYVDTYFYEKSAMPAVPGRAHARGEEYPVDELPVLGEYIEPIPGLDTKTSVQIPDDIYQQGTPLTWL